MDILTKPFIIIAHLFYAIGRSILNAFISSANLYYLIGNIVKRLPASHKYARYTLDQMMTLGISSLPLVIVTSLFTGAVAASQCAYQFGTIVPLTYLGTAISKATLSELGPVLTALVMTGRISASIAAELGTMKTNEQIDAMECLALDPLKYLVVPRVLAGIIMLVTLTIIANFIAIIGAGIVSVLDIGITVNLYTSGLKLFFAPADITAGLLKAAIFGAIITIMGCYHGLKADGGAEGVGKATMKAVVSSCVLILIFDFIVVALVF